MCVVKHISVLLLHIFLSNYYIPVRAETSTLRMDWYGAGTHIQKHTATILERIAE
jgi:hypothetical protein